MTHFAEEEKKAVETEGVDSAKPTSTPKEEPETLSPSVTEPPAEAAVEADAPVKEAESAGDVSESPPVSPDEETAGADDSDTVSSGQDAPKDVPQAESGEELSGVDSTEATSLEEDLPKSALPEDASPEHEEAEVAVPSDLKWYTLQVFTGQEEKVKKYIEIESARQGITEDIHNVHIPTQNVVEVRGGKKKMTTRVNFPGYMFIQMAINKNTHHFIRNIPNVMGFVGPDGEPVPLSEVEVHRIIGRDEAEDSMPEMRFAVGERVKVIDGPFMDFEGTVQECQSERKRLKVLVSIFGRDTPLDLAFFQVTTTEEE